MFNKTLSRDEKVSSASHVVSMQSNDLDNASANIDLPMDRQKQNEGRLTGRPNSFKENQLSKSLAETSINRFKDSSATDGSDCQGTVSVSTSLQAKTPLLAPATAKI